MALVFVSVQIIRDCKIEAVVVTAHIDAPARDVLLLLRYPGRARDYVTD
jgi:hypothetical protein